MQSPLPYCSACLILLGAAVAPGAELHVGPGQRFDRPSVHSPMAVCARHCPRPILGAQGRAPADQEMGASS